MAAKYRDFKYAPISVADPSGGVTLVAAVPGFEIRVVSYTLVSAGTVNVTFRSAATPLTGAMPLVANSGLAPVAAGDSSLFETTFGEALTLLGSAAVGVFGHLTYYLDRD